MPLYAWVYFRAIRLVLLDRVTYKCICNNYEGQRLDYFAVNHIVYVATYVYISILVSSSHTYRIIAIAIYILFSFSTLLA